MRKTKQIRPDPDPVVAAFNAVAQLTGGEPSKESERPSKRVSKGKSKRQKGKRRIDNNG